MGDSVETSQLDENENPILRETFQGMQTLSEKDIKLLGISLESFHGSVNSRLSGYIPHSDMRAKHMAFIDINRPK